MKGEDREKKTDEVHHADYKRKRKSKLPRWMQASGDRIGQEPMHPDDVDAHLASVTVKRFHEFILEKTFAEKPVYYRIKA
jgi:hypothetical protein